MRAASAVEYALLCAVFCLGVFAAACALSRGASGVFSSISAALANAAPTLTEPVPDASGTAFAVYSTTDHSLRFYKRDRVPEAGDIFDGRRVTEVYTGIETSEYYASGSRDWQNLSTNAPWELVRPDILTVNVEDEGIAPRSLNNWFYKCSSLRSADLSRLDASKVTSAYMLFILCDELEELSLPSFGSSLSGLQDSFSYCPNLTVVDLSSSDLSGCKSYYHTFLHDLGLEKVILPPKASGSIASMLCAFCSCPLLSRIENFPVNGWAGAAACDMGQLFTGCSSLVLDCSSWDVSNVASHVDFAAGAPGVAEPSWPM